MYKIKNLSIVTLILILSVNLYSQKKWGLGISAIYNLQTESFGAGLRAEIPMNRFSLVPQIAYYPAFNKIHEYYAGISLHFNMFNIKNFTVYAIGHASYNGWLNYSSSAIEGASSANIDGEGGIGITTRACFRPFLEYRYNVKWRETNLRLGLMYFFNCKKGKKKSAGRKRKGRAIRCPAYN